MKTKMTARTLTMALAAMAVATAFGQGDEIAPIQIGQPTPPVQAQSAPGPRLEIRLRVLREGLQLTDEQAAKVRAILEETRKSGQAVRAQQDLKPEERRQKLDTLHEAEREKLLQVFTEEQREKFSKMPPAAAPQGPVGEGFPVIPIPGQRGPGAQGARVPGQPGVPMPPMQGGPGFGHQGGPGLGPQGRRGTQGGPGGPGFGPPGRRGQGPQGGMMPPMQGGPGGPGFGPQGARVPQPPFGIANVCPCPTCQKWAKDQAAKAKAKAPASKQTAPPARAGASKRGTKK